MSTVPGSAARIGDPTDHGGRVAGPGVSTVLIGKKPAAVVGSMHLCSVPQPHPPSVFGIGSTKVKIGKLAALRVADAAPCGGKIVDGATGVIIGG